EVIAGGQRILDVGGPLGFGSGDFVQVVDASGHTYRTLSDAGKLPPNDDALAAAKGRPGSSFSDARIGGEEVRVFTIPVQDDRAKRQLVSDASHELRTPLTSLRTNIEVLARDRNMADDEREKLLNDVVSQLSEMTALVTELVELARGETQPQQAEDVRLDLLV